MGYTYFSANLRRAGRCAAHIATRVITFAIAVAAANILHLGIEPVVKRQMDHCTPQIALAVIIISAAILFLKER